MRSQSSGFETSAAIAVRAQLGGRRLDLLGRARGERELEALVAEHPRDREPDARGASGDERRRHAFRLSQKRARSRSQDANLGAIPRLLLSPECDGGSPAAVAYFGRRDVSLTSLAPSGGCAAKYPAARLEELLRGFVPAEAENLLVGLAPADDAAVYKLDDERALVFTLDFFPPLVDDPALFGRIAATNALNDVFAMGGSPLLALSIAAFPESLPNETLAAIFGAADEQVRAAGAILAGGHTLRDDEPKYGLAVVGTVHPDGFWAKSGARPGDALFLTKPLGTGLLLHAAREGRRHEQGLATRRPRR